MFQMINNTVSNFSTEIDLSGSTVSDCCMSMIPYVRAFEFIYLAMQSCRTLEE